MKGWVDIRAQFALIKVRGIEGRMKAGLMTTEIKLNFKLAVTKRPSKYSGSRNRFVSLSHKIPR